MKIAGVENWDWTSRIDAMVAAVTKPGVWQGQLERASGVSDGEIREVEQAIGFSLDERFLGFFRATNGLRVMWGEAPLNPGLSPLDELKRQLRTWTCGRVNVPSLRDIFLSRYPALQRTSADTGTVKCLGGWPRGELRDAMRTIDDFEQGIEGASYVLPALICSPRYPDPVVLMLTDHGACVDDCRPMLASDYLAKVVMTIGFMGDLRVLPMTNHGAGGDYPIFTPRDGWLADLTPLDVVMVALTGEGVPELTAVLRGD